jgi:heme O synthase-like polyprenyltransferase
LAFTIIAMSVSSNAKNHVNKDEKRRIKRTYKRNYRSPIIRPVAITAFGIASIITAVMMLSSGAYFVAYTSSIHAT